MKYGILFAIVSILLLLKSASVGAAIVLLWPALSFAIVASGYLALGAAVFGKKDGRLPRLRVLVLLPYLFFLWSLWHVLRKLNSENAFDHVDDQLIVGRRLLPGELPEAVNLVVDLTCEFNESDSVRGPRYLCLPLLDATAPDPELLFAWAEQVAKEAGVIYIHCAEGHGRTGLFAAALMLRRGQAASADDAIATLQACRPGIALNRQQRRVLEAIFPRSG